LEYKYGNGCNTRAFACTLDSFQLPIQKFSSNFYQVFQSECPQVCLFVHLSVCPFISQSACTSIRIPVHLTSAYLSVFPSVCLISVCLYCLRPSIYSSNLLMSKNNAPMWQVLPWFHHCLAFSASSISYVIMCLYTHHNHHLFEMSHGFLLLCIVKESNFVIYNFARSQDCLIEFIEFIRRDYNSLGIFYIADICMHAIHIKH